MTDVNLLNSNSTHLKLCINDLLHPTEKSESLLEELTSSQLDEIEKTLRKIKEKKQSTEQNVATLPISQNANQNLQHDWAIVAAQIAKALADTITNAANNTKNTTKSTTTTTTTNTTSVKTSSSTPTPTTTTSTTPVTTITSDKPTTTIEQSESTTIAAAGSVVPNHEPRTEIREGVEWVSFVYSHHRVLRRYSIRTDVDQVDIGHLDDKFKSENCVYPRANLPRDQYRGNRWAYETECNTLGWKLAYLNSSEIAGKRGLIQRAVDSYRNRYPSMRSRRVARQEKLLKGTLRKRKQRDADEEPTESAKEVARSPKVMRCTEDENHQQELPKTVSIDDGLGSKHRIRIHVDAVSLDSIDIEFRRANCVYPRAMDINTKSPFASQRQLEEAKCNELGWKLAWLNPKPLANRKNLLQRVLDVYRSKFLPELNPRKNSFRMPQLSIDTTLTTTKTPLTVAALAAQQEELSDAKVIRRGTAEKMDDNESLYSGTTDSLDFRDCFSPPAEHADSPYLCSSATDMCNTSSPTTLSPVNDLMLSVPSSSDELLFGNNNRSDSCRLSISSSSSNSSIGSSDMISPTIQNEDGLFKDVTMLELYADPIQLPSAGVDFEHCDFKTGGDIDHLNDPLFNQLFFI
ncbi:hypothetical protein K501DRAFT_278435 [Backusella circina FSU 941]|nr:hypothetical protein K501DRAFT_278435 [Backusella circina FSU 941]